MKVNKLSFNSQLTLTKKTTTSGGSRKFFFFKNTLPLKFSYKKLMIKLKYNSGRNNTGHIVINTKKSQNKNNTKPIVNYSFRSLYLGLIAGFLMIPKSNKLISLLMLSSGIVNFVPSSTNHKLFILTRFKSLTPRIYQFTDQQKILSPLLTFQKSFFTLALLPKNKPICLIEAAPVSSIIYTRSTGSSAYIIKMNSLTSTALVKLSSGVKKVFSTHSLASLGKVNLPEKKSLFVNKAGYLKSFGKKSKVRGVAKNPVDHPHGGRTKAIKYQRTPWGKTTKYK